MDAGTACGIAGSFLDQNDRTRANLISVWTAPTHRKRGIGRLLVNEVLNWARGRNARALQLMVTSNNKLAIRFYQRLGFTQTGRTEPYPNDPAVVEYEMSRPIPQGIPLSPLHNAAPSCDACDSESIAEGYRSNGEIEKVPAKT